MGAAARRVVCLIGLAGCAHGAIAGPVSFTELQLLPGASWSAHWGISGNGAVASGTCFYPSSARACRWVGGVPEALALPSFGTTSIAEAANADGSIIVGAVEFGGPATTAYLWNRGVPHSLGLPPLGTFSHAIDVSDDGSAVACNGGPGGSLRACRWTQATGMVNLGLLPATDRSSAEAISRDGSTVVGWCVTGVVTGKAFRWVEGQGMLPLGAPTGASDTYAYDVNADGSVVVGLAQIGANAQPIRWAADGLTLLPLPVGAVGGGLRAVSADGSVMVGGYGFASGAGGPCYWIDGVFYDLNAMLDPLLPAGWDLSGATDVSADGRTIMGLAFVGGEARGWTATIPSPGWVIVPSALGAMVLTRRRGRTCPQSPTARPLAESGRASASGS